MNPLQPPASAASDAKNPSSIAADATVSAGSRSPHTAAPSTLHPADTVASAAPGDDSSATPGARLKAKVAVLGAAGYTGQEFCRLALSHPGIELVALSSREHAGRPAGELLPGLDPRALALPKVCDPSTLDDLLQGGGFDTLVCCLPHGAWREMAAQRPALASGPTRIVDLSSDHRDGSSGYAYGLPEAYRASLAGANRIANPGCYPTAATLALLPAAEDGWLEEPVSITAVSGVSGAGRKPELRTSFVELDGGAAVYKADGSHPHVAEIERQLGRLSGGPLATTFAPMLAPMARGILLTATARLAVPLTPETARARYLERYENEPFVRVLDPGLWPETRAVRGSNRCDLAVTTLHGGRTLLVSAAIDNLVKGAAGQAMQNLNLALGWPESWSLPIHGTPW